MVVGVFYIYEDDEHFRATVPLHEDHAIQNR